MWVATSKDNQVNSWRIMIVDKGAEPHSGPDQQIKGAPAVYQTFPFIYLCILAVRCSYVSVISIFGSTVFRIQSYISFNIL